MIGVLRSESPTAFCEPATVADPSAFLNSFRFSDDSSDQSCNQQPHNLFDYAASLQPMNLVTSNPCPNTQNPFGSVLKNPQNWYGPFQFWSDSFLSDWNLTKTNLFMSFSCTDTPPVSTLQLLASQVTLNPNTDSPVLTNNQYFQWKQFNWPFLLMSYCTRNHWTWSCIAT